MIRRPPRSTRTDTLFPTRRSSDLIGTTAASDFLSWPNTVDFLLYPAGTWVKGAADVLTLDTNYDSVGLGQNNYTALFTEEGYLMAKMCHDSRVITVPHCPDGATAAGVDIDCDGGENGRERDRTQVHK